MFVRSNSFSTWEWVRTSEDWSFSNLGPFLISTVKAAVIEKHPSRADSKRVPPYKWKRKDIQKYERGFNRCWWMLQLCWSEIHSTVGSGWLIFTFLPRVWLMAAVSPSSGMKQSVERGRARPRCSVNQSSYKGTEERLWWRSLPRGLVQGLRD